jgi:hypothetical protein
MDLANLEVLLSQAADVDELQAPAARIVAAAGGVGGVHQQVGIRGGGYRCVVLEAGDGRTGERAMGRAMVGHPHGIHRAVVDQPDDSLAHEVHVALAEGAGGRIDVPALREEFQVAARVGGQAVDVLPRALAGRQKLRRGKGLRRGQRRVRVGMVGGGRTAYQQEPG